ncbi:hypothetical protein HPP92_027017 [Vanilla planifolia]|uniref:Uncharacterized protein n=1 Tax=Vanilla planifolia TaxID=51239 RepID=A0A835URD0_VANPL|nr:hypothetical protein HPP92_027017 [Vanilla planifolia]KAG0469840.1 hypothetical protein HPP92_016540 [Vanilla planifolia]
MGRHRADGGVEKGEEEKVRARRKGGGWGGRGKRGVIAEPMERVQLHLLREQCSYPRERNSRNRRGERDQS